MQNKTSPTALVVNDDPLQLRLTAALLEKEGIRPLTCSSVEEALRTLDTQQSVDLIITDLHMPKIDGWRFCRLLRSPEYARYNTIPILVMSATLAGSDAEQITADLGANAFLSIPYNPSTFRAQVRALLKGETPRATLQVLLVEDSPTQAKILRQAFEAHGYVVRRARLGAEGRRLFQRYQPEIVVLDYHLPDMTADHLLEEIKEAVPTTVVIMITGNPTPELALRFMKQGADGYLRKPFDPAYLVRLCEKARRERSLLQVEDLLKARTQELQESEARFRGLFDSIPEIVLVHDQQGEILHVNTFGAQRLAWRPVELIGKNLRELVPPEAISLLAQHLRHTLQEGKHDFEMTYITRTGEALAVEVSERCIEFGGEQAVLSVARDVTERKQAIAALKAAKEYAENLINSSLDMIISVDLDRRIIEFNRAAEQTFGYRKAEVLGKPVDILYADPVEGRRTHQRALRIQGFTGEITNRRKNGETFSSYLSASVLRNGAGEVIGVMGISRDITQSKRTETELKRLVTAVEQVAEGIIITDPQGIIYYVNPAFEQITGYRRAEVTGEHIGLLKPDPNDHTLCQAIQQVLASGEAWSGRMTSRKKDGTLFEGETTISPVRDITGNLVNHVAVLRDVTQEVELENQLRQTQKMEAIGQLAGGIAHDFNNLLTGILGYANLLKLNAQPGEQIYQAAEVIERAAERGAQLTAQLLGFARRGKYQHVAVDMHEIVQEVIRLLSRTIDKRITITQRFRTRKALVLGDPNQMQQMVLNLALNARDAMPEGGELLFTLEVVTLDEAYCRQHVEVSPGRYVLLSVTDTGVGIPKELHERIFEPFFTTKNPGEGTGMGLAMVYGIVKNHGGSIQVYSEVGHGSTFKVYLPLAVEGYLSPQPSPSPSPSPNQGRILVVDDEAMVREVVGEMLQQLGYEVITVADGQEAIDYYREWGHTIDLVILDLVMPHLGGKECWQALRTLDPQVKVLLSTGYDCNTAVQDLLEKGVCGFVQKPYRLQQLAEVVEKALHEPVRQ